MQMSFISKYGDTDDKYPQFFESGFVKKADTFEELAKLCGINETGLNTSIAKIAEFSATGMTKTLAKATKLLTVIIQIIVYRTILV
jgi:hypothetical protein